MNTKMMLLSAFALITIPTLPMHAQAGMEDVIEVGPATAPNVPKPAVRLAANPTNAQTIWSDVETVRSIEVDAVSLVIEDIANRDEPGPQRVGVSQEFVRPIDTDDHGEWRQNDDGSWTWRCRFVQPGAEATRLHFDRYELPAGSRLIVGEPTNRYTKGFGPEQRSPDGSMWTPAVPGETILIELHVPRAPEASPIRILEMVHIYDPTFGWPEADPQPAGRLYRGVVGCHIDALCQSVLIGEMNGVGRMLYDSDGGSFVCTGALLNDSDTSSTVPYFLTAHHCLSTQAEATSLEVTWFYRSVFGCDSSAFDPSVLPSSDGAILLVTNPDDATGSDRTLLQLIDSLSDGQLQLGWTTSGLGIGESAWGLHHPGGEKLRWSEGTVDSTPNYCPTLPTSNYWYGHWSQGTTEGGSSGSPLFNSNGLIVGQLFGRCGGGDRCDDRDDWNWVYGKLSHDFHELDPFILSSGEWVSSTTLFPNGSPGFPWETIAQGVNNVATGGWLYLYGGSYSETPTINKAMTINAYDGPVTIGN